MTNSYLREIILDEQELQLLLFGDIKLSFNITYPVDKIVAKIFLSLKKVFHNLNN